MLHIRNRPFSSQKLIALFVFSPFLLFSQVSVVGTGLKLESKKGEACPVVAQVWHFSPAEEEGIKPGDIVWTLDGATTENLSPAEVESRLNSSEGDKHTIEVGVSRRETKLKVRRMKGKCASGDCKNGRGSWDDPDARYEGDFQNGRFEGKGVMTYQSGNRHEGQYKAGKRSGPGKFIFATGTVYEGGFENNNFNGKGSLHHASGETYDGDWHDDSRQGQGIGTWPNGDHYEGAWSNDYRNGQGTMTYADGSKYEGTWLNNKRQGFGKMTSFEGWFYEGNWLNNLRDGYGKLRLANGQRIEGNFIKDEPPVGTVIEPPVRSANRESSDKKFEEKTIVAAAPPPAYQTPTAATTTKTRSEVAEALSILQEDDPRSARFQSSGSASTRKMPPSSDKNAAPKTRLLTTLDGFFDNAAAADQWLLDNQRIKSTTQRIENLKGLATMTSTWAASNASGKETFSRDLKISNSNSISDACLVFLTTNGQLAEKYQRLATLLAAQLDAPEADRQTEIDAVQVVIGSLGLTHRTQFEQARRLFFL